MLTTVKILKDADVTVRRRLKGKDRVREKLVMDIFYKHAVYYRMRNFGTWYSPRA